jgi:hypothetical protein
VAAGLGERLHFLDGGERLHMPEDDLAAAVLGKIGLSVFGIRADGADVGENVGLLDDFFAGGGDGGSALAVGFIGKAGGESRSRFHEDVEFLLRQAWKGNGYQGNTPLPGVRFL